MVHSVQDLSSGQRKHQIRKHDTYNTHALPCSNQGCNPDKEADGRKSSPATTGRAQSENYCTERAANNATNTETPSEDDAWPVTVANCVSDKVGMCLMSQSPFDGADDLTERRGMCCDRQGTKEFGRLLIRKV